MLGEGAKPDTGHNHRRVESHQQIELFLFIYCLSTMVVCVLQKFAFLNDIRLAQDVQVRTFTIIPGALIPDGESAITISDPVPRLVECQRNGKRALIVRVIPMHSVVQRQAIVFTP